MRAVFINQLPSKVFDRLLCSFRPLRPYNWEQDLISVFQLTWMIGCTSLTHLLKP